MSEAHKRSHNLNFDVMNIMACVAVIAIHHNGLVHTYQDSLAWRQALVAEVGLYWCVPIFLMLTGATLIDYQDRQTTSQYFKRRLCRTVIPWLFWSCVILAEKMYTGEINLDPPIFKNAVSLVLSNRVESVYWYFDALFPIYIVIPVLSSLRHDRTRLWYIVWVNFIFVSIYPILKAWLGLSFSLAISMGGSLIIYVILGYLLRDWKPKELQLAAVLSLSVLCAVFRYCYTLYFSVQKGITDTSIKGYGVFHAVLLSVGVYVLLNSINWNALLKPRLQRLVTWLSSCSFGIYLIHKIVMRAEMRFYGLENTRLLWRVFCIPLTYLISLSIVAIIKTVPILNRTVG